MTGHQSVVGQFQLSLPWFASLQTQTRCIYLFVKKQKNKTQQCKIHAACMSWFDKHRSRDQRRQGPIASALFSSWSPIALNKTVDWMSLYSPFLDRNNGAGSTIGRHWNVLPIFAHAMWMSTAIVNVIWNFNNKPAIWFITTYFIVFYDWLFCNMGAFQSPKSGV